MNEKLELQNLFYQEIPITKSMGLSVLAASDDTVEISFRLAENKNHKGTAFGGSQYTACALACYGLFLVGIRKQGYATNNIVIADGQIKYKQPVHQDFKVIAQWDAETRRDFFHKLTLKKKAKVKLNSTISHQGQRLTEFSGDFVAVL